jgi:hypothetical protein
LKSSGLLLPQSSAAQRLPPQYVAPCDGLRPDQRCCEPAPRVLMNQIRHVGSLSLHRDSQGVPSLSPKQPAVYACGDLKTILVPSGAPAPPGPVSPGSFDPGESKRTGCFDPRWNGRRCQLGRLPVAVGGDQSRMPDGSGAQGAALFSAAEQGKLLARGAPSKRG